MNESCHTFEWVMSHISMSHVAHMSESCRTYEWVMLHIWMSHVTNMSESCHTYEIFLTQGMWHILDELCPTNTANDRVMSHTHSGWRSHVTHTQQMKESCHTHTADEGVMSHTHTQRMKGGTQDGSRTVGVKIFSNKLNKRSWYITHVCVLKVFIYGCHCLYIHFKNCWSPNITRDICSPNINTLNTRYLYIKYVLVLKVFIYGCYRVAKTHRIPYLLDVIFRKSDLYVVALLWKMICNLGDPMSLRHPVMPVYILQELLESKYSSTR